MIAALRLYDDLVDEVVAGVLHEQFPRSGLVILPPCFGAAELAMRFRNKIAEAPSAPPVALMSPDEVRDGEAYLRGLARQWGLRVAEGHASLEARFELLFAEGSRERPLIQVVNRFHRVLETLESWVLGLMRTEEQRHRLRSVVISPYSYAELKRHWRIGHKLTVSDYGDTHICRSVAPPDERLLRERCEALGTPEHIVEYALALTGGFPEVLVGVLECWVRLGRPIRLDRQLQSQLRLEASSRLTAFVRLLDEPGRFVTVRQVIDVHLGVPNESRYQLTRHPWAAQILRDDGTLRAESLGEQAVEFWLAECRGSDDNSPASLFAEARGLFRLRQFGASGRLSSSLPDDQQPPAMKLLARHAAIMTAVFGQTGSGSTSEDSDWSTVAQQIKSAEETLTDLRTSEDWKDLVRSRYRELGQIAIHVRQAEREGQARVVDILGGAYGARRPGAAETAALLVLLGIETGRAVSGNAMAIRIVLALPEQIFRLWALWRFSLNYYCAPVLSETTWTDVLAVWPYDAPSRPDEGTDFPSFELFTYVATALHLASGSGTAPEPDWTSLKKALSSLGIRRDAAHAVVSSDRKQRERYFDLIERWCSAMIDACPERTTREELLAKIDPLPLLEDDL